MEENKDFQDIDIIQDEFIFLVDEFCQLHKIDDMVKESQNRFNAALTYIYTHKIKNTFDIKPKEDIYHRIDIDTLIYIYNNIYVHLCNIYNKVVNISSFSYLVGIDHNTLLNWLNEYNDYYSLNGDDTKDKLNIKRKDFLKTAMKNNEDSLENLLTSGKTNPVGVLAVLNHSHGWNLPGVSREVAKPALTAENLPKLSNNLPPNEPINCLPNSNNSECVKSTQNQGLEQL